MVYFCIPAPHSRGILQRVKKPDFGHLVYTCAGHFPLSPVIRLQPLSRRLRAVSPLYFRLSGDMAQSLLSCMPDSKNGGWVETVFSILVADQNKYIRGFLKRELEAEGYSVALAADHREIFGVLDSAAPPDLLVLDLNIPYTGGLHVLLRLQNRAPSIPVVVHTVFTEYESHPAMDNVESLVEKKGDPDLLKREIRKALRKHYPDRPNAGAGASLTGHANLRPSSK